MFGFGCRTFFSDHNEPKSRKIADQTKINSEWKEIVPEKPLVATSKIQIIGLKLNNIKGWKDENKKEILLENGDILKVEIELVDAKGNKTKLYPNGFGEFAVFGKRSKSKENFETGFFKVGEKFTKVRLRSNPSIKVDEINWGEFEF